MNQYPHYLPEPFSGYRVHSRYIIDPKGQRITPERLKGILWRDEMELRRAGYAYRRKAEEAKKRFGETKVKVVVVELADWHQRHFGNIAG